MLTKNFKSKKVEKNIDVSILCITYNHGLYISRCLESFLMQKTNFSYEIIIHDDASTDNTQKIIESYRKKYPHIIKPIIQNKNTFSINFHLPFKRALEECSGKFIALCEGDDFWISDDKLEIQAKVMQMNPSINISFHASKIIDNLTVKHEEVFCNYSKNMKKISLNKIILGDGAFMPTASVMVRAITLKSLPDWYYKIAPVGDFYSQIFCAKNNGAIFIPSIFSAYRTNISTNWTATTKNIKTNKWIESHLDSLNFSKENISLLSRMCIDFIKLKYFLNYVYSSNFSYLEKIIEAKKRILQLGIFNFFIVCIITLIPNKIINKKYENC